MTDAAPGLALLFPGQGSQHVGMGRALAARYPEAARTFREADEILGFPFSRLLSDGPEEELTRTHNAQPAILAHSVAVLRTLAPDLEADGRIAMAAGHSLGEFSAHVAAGTLRFEDALRAVRLRGELMYSAGGERPGTMLAVLGMDDPAVEALCEEVSAEGRGVVVPANYNSEGQVVLSGDVAAVDEAARRAPDRGARRVVPLQVSGAFHSPLMGPAREGLADHLDTLEFRDPAFPVYSNVTAAPVTSGSEARRLLVEQLTAPVRWRQGIEAMRAGGAARFAELGPGSVLTGLNRRNAKGVPSVAIGDPEQLDAWNDSREAV